VVFGPVKLSEIILDNINNKKEGINLRAKRSSRITEQECAPLSVLMNAGARGRRSFCQTAERAGKRGD